MNLSVTEQIFVNMSIQISLDLILMELCFILIKKKFLKFNLREVY